MSQTILENISIGSPNFDENTQFYTFDLKRNNGLMSFVSNSEYTLSTRECSQTISIPKREELKLFHEIYKELKKIFLENHVKWFENKFSEGELDILFRSFLIPNISENRIDLQVNVNKDLLKTLNNAENEKGYVLGVPCFLFEKLVLNLEDEKMECIISINDFKCKNEGKNNTVTLGEDKTQESPDISEPVVSEKGEDEEPPANTSAVNNNTDTGLDGKDNKDVNVEEGEEGEEHQEETEKNNDYLEEVDFNGEELERVNVNFNNEEYYVIYKYLTRLVNETLHKELRDVMNEKEVNMKSVNLSEIIDDSDCESEISDSESYDSDLNNHL